jgi:hypothetical protein
MIYKTFEQWKSGNVLEHGVPRTEHYSEDQLDLVEMGWNYGYDAGRAVEQALDKKAENAREFGLDYEPVPENFMDALRFDVAMRDAAPVQEPVGLIARLKHPEDHYEFTDPKKANAVLMSLCQEAADALAAPVQPVAWMSNKDFEPIRIRIMMEAYELAERDVEGYNAIKMLCSDIQRMLPAQRQWVGLTDEDVDEAARYCVKSGQSVNAAIRAIEAKLKEKNAAAQPAVPDALTSADIQEHIEYVAGWNDCRQAMLEMMK